MDMPLIPKPHLGLTLTGKEIVFLTDAIDNGDIAKGLDEKEVYIPLARRVLLILGSAYREVVTPKGVLDKSVTIQVDEETTWLFRNKVKTGDLAVDNRTPVGLTILPKLYALLIQFNSGLEDLKVVDVDEPPVSDEIRQKLADFSKPKIEVENARTSKNARPVEDEDNGAD